MKSTLVSFADAFFIKSQEKLNESATKFGIDKISQWNPSKLKQTSFYKNHKNIFEHKRGFGFWSWKPFIILETLKGMENEEVLIYSDSGIEIINSLEPLISLLDSTTGVLVFNNCDYPNRLWTKRDCFILMGLDEARYWDAQHIEGAFIVLKKNALATAFVEEWLFWSSNIDVISDGQNQSGKENFLEFRDHRHDQAILSILAEKYSLDIFRCPSQFGNYFKLIEFRNENEFVCRNHFEMSENYSDHPYFNSRYGTLLDHHRVKNKLTVLEKLVYHFQL